MIKLIAELALLACAVMTMLGNYWFTFGLWPCSWLAFFGFAAAAITINLLLTVVIRSED